VRGSRMKRRATVRAVAALFAIGGVSVSAYEAMYARTPVGTVEIKRIPAATALETRGLRPYAEISGESFRTLFRYIQANNVKMTVPVEAEMDPGAMRFLAGTNDAARGLAADGKVVVAPRPERTVVSAGLRGRYTRARFDEGFDRLRQWLASHPEWVPAGEPYAVYWNSPFVLPFLRHSEVHLPVAPTDGPR